MSTAVLVDLVVGELIPGEDAPLQPVSLAEAAATAALAEGAGVAALRLVDGAPGVRAVDPSVAAAFLAGKHGDLGYLVDVPTTHNAPYNLARRVLSFDRAAAGARRRGAYRPGPGPLRGWRRGRARHSGWVIQRHFRQGLEHISSPLVMLASVAEHTRRIRLG